MTKSTSSRSTSRPQRVAAPSNGAGSTTRVAIVPAFDGARCSARLDEGCENPLILRGTQRNPRVAVVVNIAVDENGNEVPVGEVGVKWSRQVLFHPECYERIGKPIWGEPSNDRRSDGSGYREAIPRPMPFRN